MDTSNNDNQIQNLRIIKTARDIDSINKAAAEGFKPLFKRVEPSEEIKSKYGIFRDKKTGEFHVFGDFRSIIRNREEYDEIIDWTFYYPHNFESPFAAYLIPNDIGIGERVMIDDLIEDFVDISWNQGDVYRLSRCEAIWDGTDLVIQYDTDKHSRWFRIG